MTSSVASTIEAEQEPMVLFELESGAVLEVNDAWVRLYGYSREEALAMKVCALAADPVEVERATRVPWETPKKHIDLRWHRAKDGTVFPLEVTASQLEMDGRKVAIATLRDLSDRHDLARQLKRSELRFRALIESLPDAVLVHRLGEILYVSPTGRTLLGYGPEETDDEKLEGRSVLDIVHPDEREVVVGRLKQMLTTGRRAPPLEHRLLRRDGTTWLAEVVSHDVLYDGTPAVLTVARDVTARREMEAQLVMSDRLAALGRLSASVGHELNNPLAYVLGNLEMLQRELARIHAMDQQLGDRLQEHVTMIRDGAVRMRDIVRDLKMLARGDGSLVAPIDLRSVLEVCTSMAEREVRSRAKLVREFGSRVVVVGSEARFGQVFLNLLLNAAQSIPDGDPDGNEVRVTVTTPEPGRVAIEIRDSGVGISDEIRDRIFEPFFTTKEGAGTGLGLSICHRIVTSANGTLTAHANASGRGSTFRVVLPLASSDAH